MTVPPTSRDRPAAHTPRAPQKLLPALADALAIRMLDAGEGA